MKRYIYLLITSIIFLAVGNTTELLAKSKDLILVIDTSLSMAGYGGDNIMPLVKKSLPKFIDQLDIDDSLTLVTFDTEVRVYPTVQIKHKSNKEILNKYISMIEAKGKWTYTMAMIDAVFTKAKMLQQENPNREQVIVIITDAIDDPPPDARTQRFDIKKIAQQYSGSEWFIFFINIKKAQSDSKYVELQKEVKKSVSPYTKVIEVKEPIDKVITTDLKKEIETASKIKDMQTQKKYAFYVVIVLVTLAIIVIIFFVLRRLAYCKVTGILEYWNNELINPNIERVNLTAKNSRSITIGRDTHSAVRIHDFALHVPIQIKAIREKGKSQCVVIAPETELHFVNREPGNTLRDGDIFKVRNYTFKYYEG